jgi:peptide chain release factor 2
VIRPLERAESGLRDAGELLELAAAENDAATAEEVRREVAALARLAADMEFKRMFSGEMDGANAFVDIQSGTGGTEAQDWASMLLRMYLRFCADMGFKTEILDESRGEVAGIKGASFYVQGPYAYGWLRTEIGVHRLVRKSPFDSNARRHTSFAAVFVSPEVDDNISRPDHRLPVRSGTGDPDRAHGRHRTRRSARHPHQGTRGPGVDAQGRHHRPGQDRHRDHRQDDAARRAHR